MQKNCGHKEDVNMKTVTEKHVRVQHEEIAELARQIWESEGRQAGRDLDYWLLAERQLRSSRDPGRKLPPRRLATETETVEPHGTGKAIRLPDSVTKLVQAKRSYERSPD